MTDHRWTDLAAPYALGALDREERVAFERHLETCASCRAEVQTFQEVTGQLAHSAPTAPPPPQLRERVLREARRVRPIAGRRRVLVPLVAAAAIALVLGGQSYWSARSARIALQHALDSTQAQLDALLDSSVAITDLAATGKLPTMRLYWNRTRNIVVVAAFQLPPAPAGRTYQLWAIKKGQAPVSLGTFDTPATGRAVVTLTMPAGFNPDVSAVTEEPAGGSPQPTTQPFLVGSWPRSD